MGGGGGGGGGSGGRGVCENTVSLTSSSAKTPRTHGGAGIRTNSQKDQEEEYEEEEYEEEEAFTQRNQRRSDR